MSQVFVPWPEERVRFEREFKPALAKLIRQHFPHWRLTGLKVQGDRITPDGLGTETQMLMTIVDGISNVTLEEKS